MSKVRTHTLPDIVWLPTANKQSRNGQHVRRIVLHTWGSPPGTTHRDIERYFRTPHTASAHFVYAGSAWPNRIAQMVRYSEAAWAEKSYNDSSVEIECSDIIWHGKDPAGLEQLAHIVGFLLHHFKLKPAWLRDGGFCRHGDLGVAGGSHPLCPTADKAFFGHFGALVHAHYHAGGYRSRWGR